MKYLLNNIKSSGSKVLAQFKTGSFSYSINSVGKASNISINGHDIINCSDSGIGYDRVAHLIKDLISNGINSSDQNEVFAYICRDAKLSDSILLGLNKGLESSIKIVTQSKELPNNVPLKFNIEEALVPNTFIKKIKEFAQAIHDINETLRVCREDILSLSCGRIVNTMWGAKPTQQIMINMKNSVEENEDWEKIEFFVNIILKSIERLVLKINSPSYNTCSEEQKVVSTVLIPNIIQSFEKIKVIVSKVLMMLSNFVYIDEVFKKNTSYPASWFINSEMFEDLKLDYKNIVLFALKIPCFEQEIIYPLDMMKHSFVNNNEIGI